MSKIIIILLLSTGVFSILDNNGAEIIKPDEVNNDELETPVGSTETDMPNEKPITDANTEAVKPKSKTEKAPVLLDKEQINLLAEKVIRIHGVELGSDDEENQKNIHNLRNLVSNVEKNLNEKLKLSQARKTNLNAENKVAGSQSEASETPRENLEQNVDTTSDTSKEKMNDDAIESNDKEQETSNEILDIESNIEAEIDTSESAINENEINNEEIDVNNKGTDENEQHVTAEKIGDKSNIEDNDNVAEASETEDLRFEVDAIGFGEETGNANEGTAKEDITVKYADDVQIDIKENPKAETNVIDDVRSEADTINLDLEKDNENDDTIEEVVTEKAEEDAIVINDDINTEINEPEDVRSELEEAEQNQINDDTTDISTKESTEEDESETKHIEEEEISGACSLNNECEQADTIHAYSEEYNSEKVTEQDLEAKVEDNHIQRLIKFVTSIF